MDEALELRREHHVHEHDAQAEGEHEVQVALGERLGAARPLDVVEGRHVELRRDAVDVRDGGGERQLGQQVGDDRHRALAVDAVDLGGPEVLPQAHEIAEPDERAAVGPHGEVPDVVRRAPPAGLGP